MDIREVELPGIGRKYTLRPAAGKMVTAVLHNTGERELLTFESGEETPTCSVRLDEAEGRRLGAILSGAFYQPAGEARLETLLGELTFFWHTVEGSRWADRTLGEMAVRSETGASVVARLRKDEPPVLNPGPELAVRQGDTLVVVGSREQIERFRTFAGG